MQDVDEATRAQRRSRAFLAHRAEMAAAQAVADAAARRNRDASERERAEFYAQEFGHSGSWAGLGIAVLLGLVTLLFVERTILMQEVSACFEGAKRPHNYNCANRIAGSIWAWLIPSDMAEELHAAQLTR